MKKIKFIIIILSSIWPNRPSAQIFNFCKRDISIYCQNKISENDIVLCLKKRTNILNPKCFEYVAEKINQMIKTSRSTNVLPVSGNSGNNQTPSTVPSLSIKEEEEKIVDEKRYKKRLAACNNAWAREWWGRKRKNCEAYANMKPDSKVSKCMADLVEKKKTPEEQYTYEVEIYEMCNDSFKNDIAWKNCFQKNRKVRWDYIVTYNMCEPKIKRCIDSLNKKRNAYSNKNIEKYYYEYCFQNFDSLEEENQCVAELGKKGADYLNRPFEIGRFCNNEYRDCIKYIVKRNKIKNLNYKEHVVISSSCHTRVEANEDFEAASCYYDIQKKYQVNISDAQLFCHESSKRARDCLLSAMDKKISFKTAKENICLVNSVNIQNCLMDFYSDKKSSLRSLISGDINSGTFWYCAMEDNYQKQCFLQTIEKKKAVSEEVFREVASECRKDHSSFNKCYQDFTTYFEYFTFDYYITKDLAVNICEIPIEEMRVCILDDLMNKSVNKKSSFFKYSNRKEFPFPAAYNKCQNKILKNILADMNGNGEKWKCRFADFDALSLEEQNDKCFSDYNYGISNPYCLRFKNETVPHLSNSEIAAICERMNTAVNLRRGPLYKECHKRKMSE